MLGLQHYRCQGDALVAIGSGPVCEFHSVALASRLWHHGCVDRAELVMESKPDDGFLRQGARPAPMYASILGAILSHKRRSCGRCSMLTFNESIDRDQESANRPPAKIRNCYELARPEGNRRAEQPNVGANFDPFDPIN